MKKTTFAAIAGSLISLSAAADQYPPLGDAPNEFRISFWKQVLPLASANKIPVNAQNCAPAALNKRLDGIKEGTLNATILKIGEDVTSLAVSCLRDGKIPLGVGTRLAGVASYMSAKSRQAVGLERGENPQVAAAKTEVLKKQTLTFLTTSSALGDRAAAMLADKWEPDLRGR